MQIINNACALYIVKNSIYQWKLLNEIEIKILNGLKKMNLLKKWNINLFINKIDEQSVTKKLRGYGVTERTDELTLSQITSNINLLIHWNEWVNLLIQWNEWVNLLIQWNEPNLSKPNITHKFERKPKR